MAAVVHKHDITSLSNTFIVFVVGGPGSGKGTQCELIIKKYGFKHLSTGDLLRDEVQSGSVRGKQLNAIMEKGDLVPLEVVLDLVKEAMIHNSSDYAGFLIDGYPREQSQGVQFEQQVKQCDIVLYFEVCESAMIERLLARGKTSGRVDDNEETIKHRLETFHERTEPVVTYYSERNKLRKISAEGNIDDIFVEVCKVFDDCGCKTVQ